MPRVYHVPLDATAITVAADLFEITPADDKPCCVHAVYIGQTTELGDTAEEQLEVEIRRGGTGITSGSGGSAPTPIGANSVDTAAGFGAEVANTTVATFTGGVLVLSDTFNVRTGWQYVPLPEDRIWVTQANGGLVVRLGGAPADSITFAGYMVVEEYP